MRTWISCLSLLFAVSGWARLPVPPPACWFAVNDRVPNLSVDGRAVPPLDVVVVPGAGEEKGAGR